MAMTKKSALQITHTLSQTSKMPGKSYSISAFSCKTGSKLAQIEGSVCHKCYARRGAYRWKPTVDAMAKREASLSHPDWSAAMATLVKDEEHFRWHDSGDIQSVDHFRKICEVAEATRATSHWLPTKETGFVKAFDGDIPNNLVVRVSAPKIDSPILKGFKHTSRTMTEAKLRQAELEGSHICPADKQDGKCGDCRACWDANVKDVVYPLRWGK